MKKKLNKYLYVNVFVHHSYAYNNICSCLYVCVCVNICFVAVIYAINIIHTTLITVYLLYARLLSQCCTPCVGVAAVSCL